MTSSFSGTEGRDRTGTSVTSLVFETNASTDSATSAQNRGKNTLFFDCTRKKMILQVFVILKTSCLRL